MLPLQFVTHKIQPKNKRYYIGTAHEASIYRLESCHTFFGWDSLMSNLCVYWRQQLCCLACKTMCRFSSYLCQSDPGCLQEDMISIVTFWWKVPSLFKLQTTACVHWERLLLHCCYSSKLIVRLFDKISQRCFTPCLFKLQESSQAVPSSQIR